MTKKIRLSLFFFLLFIGAATCYADKFGSSFSRDYMTQDTASSLRNKPSIPQSPQVATVPSSQTTVPMPPVITAPLPSPGVSLPQPSTDWTGRITSLPGTTNLKQLKISIPEYEKRLQEMMRTQEEKAKAKKKSLLESILNEITRYGIYIVLGLVILIVLYALHKDKPTVALPPVAKPEDPEGAPKKSIWDDEF